MAHVISEAPSNDTDHMVDPELVAQNPDEVAIWGYLMTQYGLKAGLRKFGERAGKAAAKELKTLHVMNTWKPKHYHELLKEQRSKALSSLIFIKEKWDGTMKGRACVDGSPQQKTIPKESAASPTVATETVFLTSLISAFEKRHNSTTCPAHLSTRILIRR